MIQKTKRPAIAGLEAILAEASRRSAPPVETWNPPYCGDIGLAIGPDGTWFYQGSAITRLPLVKLFAGVLRRDADGRFYLVTPTEKVDVSVADAPFLAVEMAVRGRGKAQEILFRTNVDDMVVCGPRQPLRFAREAGSGGLKPYVLVRGRLEALVTRALTYDVAELVVRVRRDGREVGGVWSGGKFWEVGQPD